MNIDDFIITEPAPPAGHAGTVFWLEQHKALQDVAIAVFEASRICTDDQVRKAVEDILSSR